MKNTGSTI